MTRAVDAIVGVSDHAGWAILVTATGDGTLLDRRRVTLIDAGLPTLPHHHEAQSLPPEQAVALIDRVRESAERHAQAALDALAREVPARIAGIAMRACPPLPPTIAERLSNYRAQNVADTVMYRTALAGAAEARGWKVHWYDARDVMEGRALPEKSEMGSPWTRDHKLATAGALAAARGGR